MYLGWAIGSPGYGEKFTQFQIKQPFIAFDSGPAADTTESTAAFK
jgi:hypothetical protein